MLRMVEYGLIGTLENPKLYGAMNRAKNYAISPIKWVVDFTIGFLEISQNLTFNQFFLRLIRHIDSIELRQTILDHLDPELQRLWQILKLGHIC